MLYQTKDSRAAVFLGVQRKTFYSKDPSFYPYPAADVTGFEISECILLQMPSSNSLLSRYANLNRLWIKNSKIGNVFAEQFVGFNCLKSLQIISCDVEYLPGDLFLHMPNLESIYLVKNRIKFIDKEIFDSLTKLSHVDLTENVNIDMKYNKDIVGDGFVTLNELKNEIALKCKTLDVIIKEQKNEFSKKVKKLEKKLEVTQSLLIKRENVEDLTIVVDQKEFKVKKAVLKAQSQMLFRMINENPEAELFEFTDITTQAFEEVVKFMNGAAINLEVNNIELYAAACQLEINSLTPIVNASLLRKIDQDNALDVLFVSNKYENYELKMKAFKEFKKKFPKQPIHIDLASQPEKLQKLLAAQKDMKEILGNNRV